jgi:hypothetical protein
MVGVVYYKSSNTVLPGALSFVGANVAYDDRDVSNAQIDCVNKFNEDAGKEKDSNFSVNGDDYNCTDVKVTKRASYYTHSVTVKGLEASTTYYFAMGNGIWEFKSGDSVKTFAELKNVEEPKPIFGKVLGEDGSHSDDTLVYITFSKGTKDSITYSSVTSDDGGWYLDASNVRDSDGNLISLELSNDMFKVKAIYSNYGVSDEVPLILGYFNGAYPDIVVEKNKTQAYNWFSEIISTIFAREVECGDRHCDTSAGESGYTCPEDCGTPNKCGNGTCDTSAGETATTCYKDCGTPSKCGNGTCDSSSGENATTCAKDCSSASKCGNGTCDSGETTSSCPTDCKSSNNGGGNEGGSEKGIQDICPACPSFMTVAQYNKIINGTISSAEVKDLGYGNVAKALANNSKDGTLDKDDLETALKGIGMSRGNVNALLGINMTDQQAEELQNCLNGTNKDCDISATKGKSIDINFCGDNNCSTKEKSSGSCPSDCPVSACNKDTVGQACSNNTGVCTLSSGTYTCDNSKVVAGTCTDDKDCPTKDQVKGTCANKVCNYTKPADDYCPTLSAYGTYQGKVAYCIANKWVILGKGSSCYYTSEKTEKKVQGAVDANGKCVAVTEVVNNSCSVTYNGKDGVIGGQGDMVVCKIKCGTNEITATRYDSCQKFAPLCKDSSGKEVNYNSSSSTTCVSQFNANGIDLSRISEKDLEVLAQDSAFFQYLGLQMQSILDNKWTTSTVNGTSYKVYTESTLNTYSTYCKATGGTVKSTKFASEPPIYKDISCSHAVSEVNGITSKVYAAGDDPVSGYLPGYSFYFPETGMFSLELDETSLAKLVVDSSEPTLVYIEGNGIDGFQMPADPTNPKANEDFVLSQETYKITYSQVSTAQQYTLKKGINIISFDFIPISTTSGAYTAKDVMDQAKSNGVNIEYITIFDGGRWNGGYQCSNGSCTGTNFTIVPGKGYLVYATNDGGITIPGYALKSSIPLALSSGWNLIGIHGYSTAFTARTFLDSINTVSGLTADNVSWWPTSLGMYQGLSLVDGVEYGTDFSLSPLNGYFVKISKFSPTDTACKSLIWQPGGSLNGICGNTK